MTCATCHVRVTTSPMRPIAWASDDVIERAPRSCRRSSAAIVVARMRDSAKARSSGSCGLRWWHTISMSRCSATVLTVCGSVGFVIPGSTNPTLPHTVNTVAEHLDMLMVCHHLNPQLPEDLAFAESRIRATTIAAEDLLHDLGALSITSSDAQAMGRIGEVVTRTWQVAHVMKTHLGSVGGRADNTRAKRYVAKYTVNPAIAHGLDEEIGSIEAGKLADLVLWDPRFFGIRPEVVIKGGALVWGALGDPNASIPTPQPQLMRPTLVDPADGTGADLSVTFVAPSAIEDGLGDRLGLRRRLAGVKPTRDIGKAQMINNDALPEIRVDAETFAIHIDGELVVPAPATSLPLTQLYSMF